MIEADMTIAATATIGAIAITVATAMIVATVTIVAIAIIEAIGTIAVSAGRGSRPGSRDERTIATAETFTSAPISASVWILANAARVPLRTSRATPSSTTLTTTSTDDGSCCA
jgi:hypothetical protein